MRTAEASTSTAGKTAGTVRPMGKASHEVPIMLGPPARISWLAPASALAVPVAMGCRDVQGPRPAPGDTEDR